HRNEPKQCRSSVFVDGDFAKGMFSGMAKIYRCQVQEIRWVGGDGRGGGDGATAIVSFVPQVPFHYEPGQFLSLQVPNKDNPKEMLWRAYSFSLPPEMA